MHLKGAIRHHVSTSPIPFIHCLDKHWNLRPKPGSGAKSVCIIVTPRASHAKALIGSEGKDRGCSASTMGGSPRQWRPSVEGSEYASKENTFGSGPKKNRSRAASTMGQI